MSDENYDGAIYHVQEVDDTFEGAIYHVKVVEGGGDKHNLGYYATQAALEEAHPTAEAGDWAIVGSTDTVWVWDEDSTAWVDTDTKGEVTPDMIIVKSATIPTASTTPAGAVYQYTGESNATYTHGYIYENVATTTSSSATAAQTVGSSLSDIAVDLETLESFTGWTTDNSLQIFYTGDGWSVDTTSLGVTYTGTPSVGDAITITYTAAVTTYAWTRVDVQPAPVIPDPLPSQTGHANDVLVSDGTNAGWSRTVRYFIYTKPSGQTQYTIALLGYDGSGISIVYNNNGYGFGCGTWKWYHMGENGFYNENNFPLGTSSFHWAKAYINVLNNGSDITVPNVAGEMAVKSVNTTVTLAAADWSSNTQTVSVTGVTATGVVFVSPDPSDQADYTSAGITCTAQAAGTLTFTCDTTPSNDIDVVVVQL